MEPTTERAKETPLRKGGTESFKPRFDSLVAIYEHATASFGDKPLFGTKKGGAWTWMTFREFAQQTDDVRAAFAELGVGPGDRVAIIANNRPEWAVAAYATYGRKGAFVPMYESQHADEWEYILKDCGAK